MGISWVRGIIQKMNRKTVEVADGASPFWSTVTKIQNSMNRY